MHVIVRPYFVILALTARLGSCPLVCRDPILCADRRVCISFVLGWDLPLSGRQFLVTLSWISATASHEGRGAPSAHKEFRAPYSIVIESKSTRCTTVQYRYILFLLSLYYGPIVVLST